MALAPACATRPPPPPTTAETPADGAADDALPGSPDAPVEAPSPAEASSDVAADDDASDSDERGTEPTPSEALPEPKDECTPVGVAFEQRARPKLKACYAKGKKKDPNLEGSVTLKITVGATGKIKSTKVADKTLPDPVAACMLEAIRTTPFPGVDKCFNASITIPVTFPTPR